MTNFTLSDESKKLVSEMVAVLGIEGREETMVRIVINSIVRIEIGKIQNPDSGRQDDVFDESFHVPA